MHFQLDANTAAYRDGVRGYLAKAMTSESEERIYRSGVSHDDDFAKGLVDEGYFAPSWPTEFGGQNRDAWTSRSFERNSCERKRPCTCRRPLEWGRRSTEPA